MADRVGDGATIMCGDYVDQSYGRCTSITILSQENLAFVFVDTTFTPNLYYYVGNINGREIIWGDYNKYTTGRNPNAALFRHDGNIYVVEAHDTNFVHCHYNIWQYDRGEQRMKGNTTGNRLSEARNPKVSANDDGWAVAVLHDKKYAVGEVHFAPNPQFMKVRWTERELMEGSNPDVSMLGNRVVLALTRKLSVKTFVGELDRRAKEINWGNVINVPGTGWYPSISLNSEGHILLGCQSIAGRRIKLIHGRANQNTISWNTASRTRGFFGEYPHIAFKNELDFFVNYKTNFGRTLRIMPGSITGREEHNNEGQQPQGREEHQD